MSGLRLLSCPKHGCDHGTFNVTAHVAEIWLVSQEGEFLEVEEHGAVVSCPSISNGDHFTCAMCGTDAVTVESVE